jgi:hypothetical protein
MVAPHCLPQRFYTAGFTALLFITAILFAQGVNAQRPSVAEMQVQIDALTFPYDEPAAQVRTVLDILPVFQDAVARTYYQTGVIPNDRLEAGLSMQGTDTQTSFISSVDIGDGRIWVTFGNDADPSLTDKNITFSPYSSQDGTVVWRCGNNPIPAGLYQLSDQEYSPGYTDIPASAHPQPCILKVNAAGPDLSINAQVLEPFELVETFQDAVEAAAVVLGSPGQPYAPTTRTEAGLSANATDTIGHYFSSVDIDEGVIIVTYDGDDASAVLQGKELSWTPYVSPDGTVSWLCGYAQVLTGTEPMDGTPGFNSTNMEPRYLPPQCRPSPY